MKFIHYVEIRVFCKEEDTESLLVDTLKKLVSLDFEHDKVKIQSRTAHGFEDKKIKILTLKLSRSKHTNAFVKHLLDNLSKDQKELLLKQIDSRLDERLHFFIRLDKDKLLDGEYWITDSGNCFHIKMAIAAYPHKKDIAIIILKELIKG